MLLELVLALLKSLKLLIDEFLAQLGRVLHPFHARLHVLLQLARQRSMLRVRQRHCVLQRLHICLQHLIDLDLAQVICVLRVGHRDFSQSDLFLCGTNTFLRALVWLENR